MVSTANGMPTTAMSASSIGSIVGNLFEAEAESESVVEVDLGLAL